MEGNLLFTAVEMVGMVAFALYGALVGLKYRLDLFGILLMGITASLGGGVVRDLLIGITPPAMFRDYRYLLVAVVTSLVVFLAAYLSKGRYHDYETKVEALANVFDALGLGAFNVVGVQAGINAGFSDNGFLLVMATTLLAHVAGLVLFLFGLGVFSQTGYLFLVTLLFGGDASAIAPLLVLTLKVATVSLASVTVFSGLDPDKLSNGLMWYGCPERLSFSISYAYRMLPMLMEEFQNVLLSYRLRGNPPEHQNFPGKVRYLIYQVKIIMQSFYPLMLNTAKRSRTTVEALELRGYRYAAVNKEVKKLKLSSLKVGYNDLMFLAVSLLFVAVSLLVSTLI